MRRPSFAAFMAAGAVLLLASCAHELPTSADLPSRSSAAPTTATTSVSPERTGPGAHWAEFFPLTQGSRWTFARTFTVTEMIDNVPWRYEYRSTIDDVIEGTQSLGGVPYVRETSVETDGSSTFPLTFYYRQDATGLFAADVAANGLVARSSTPTGQRLARLRAPAARERSGAERDAWLRAADALEARWSALGRALGGEGEDPPPPEIKILAYPLRTGGAWVIRDDPEFDRVVEGQEAIRFDDRVLPVWRIRTQSIYFGPHDRVVAWYGTAGFLGLEARFEQEAIDDRGTVYGTLVSEESQRLADIHLAGVRGVPGATAVPSDPGTRKIAATSAAAP